MEKSGAIERVRSESDKRKIEIRLCEKGVQQYEQEHARILKIIDHVRLSLGEENADQMTQLMNGTVKAVLEMPPME